MKDMEEIIDIMILQNMVGNHQLIMNFILVIMIDSRTEKGMILVKKMMLNYIKIQLIFRNML